MDSRTSMFTLWSRPPKKSNSQGTKIIKIHQLTTWADVASFKTTPPKKKHYIPWNFMKYWLIIENCFSWRDPVFNNGLWNNPYITGKHNTGDTANKQGFSHWPPGIFKRFSNETYPQTHAPWVPQLLSTWFQTNMLNDLRKHEENRFATPKKVKEIWVCPTYFRCWTQFTECTNSVTF